MIEAAKDADELPDEYAVDRKTRVSD